MDLSQSVVHMLSSVSPYEEVHIVLACCVSISIEVPIGVVATGEDSETNLRHAIVLIRTGFRSSERAFVV
jgi:hypothetical protein